MTSKRTSLARGLTVKLLLLQLFTLIAFALCMPALQALKGETALYGPDPKIADDLASALRRTEEGMVLVPSGRLAALVSEAPNLWFIATNQFGERLDYGPVPPTIAEYAQSFALFDTAKFSNAGDEEDQALLALEKTAWGDVRLVFGNGPVVGPLRALARSTAENLRPLAVILLVLAGATSFAIPRLIGSSLAGMNRAVRRAKMIDINRRGTRLPTADVPAEIAALVDAVNEALKRIDDGHGRQQRFLADAAHEFRTPIAILQNRIELLTKGDLDLSQCSDRLLLDVHRVANLAEQLLDLQRMDHGETPFASVDLVKVAQRVVSDLAPLAIEAGYEPQLTVDAESATVLGDRPAIERAVINLVQNAVSHGGNKGAIVVHVVSDCISVSDDGKGIDPGQREEIFEPFRRLHPKDRGAGLGLSLVREIMARHDGSVDVGESVSGGARFALRFTKAQDNAHERVRHQKLKPVAA